jgi:hypothetical protein
MNQMSRLAASHLVLAGSLLVSGGCAVDRGAEASSEEAPPAARSSAQRSAMGAPPAASVRTSLLSLRLRRDGSATLRGGEVRPFRFYGRALAAPATHRERSYNRAQLIAAFQRSGQAPAPGVLFVEAAGALRFVLPLAIGRPGQSDETGQLDRWSDQTLILKAPFFGSRSRYALYRAQLTGPWRLLDEVVVDAPR